MRLHQVGAWVLAALTACTGTPHVLQADIDPYEAELSAVRYELRVLTSGSVHTEPVEVSAEQFQQALRKLIRTVHPSDRPRETAGYLMEGALHADLLAEMERGRVVRMTPLEEDTPLLAETPAQMTRQYLDLCAREYGGGDCLGLLADGPLLQRADLRVLALAISLGRTLQETQHSLKEMVSPQALVSLILWTCCLYLTLWLLPEPTSKFLAAGLTLALTAWLGAETLWSLLDGWARLVYEADRSTSFEQLREAGQKFSKVLGENSARVLVMLVTAALSGSAVKLVEKLPRLPGFARATLQAETQAGVPLSSLPEVEEATTQGEGTFTLMVRDSRASGATAAETPPGAITLIRHQGGNRQVLINGQRWHIPANRSIQEIPTQDPVGDQLQAAAERVARNWSRSDLSFDETEAIRRARDQGKHLEAHLWERMYRGRFVERALRKQFPRLKWNPKGVDAVDPATGYRYEVLSGTNSNMELHGRRMAEELFRLIAF